MISIKNSLILITIYVYVSHEISSVSIQSSMSLFPYYEKKCL